MLISLYAGHLGLSIIKGKPRARHFFPGACVTADMLTRPMHIGLDYTFQVFGQGGVRLVMADKVNALGIASHVCSDSPAPGFTFLGAVYASGRRSWQVWRPAASFLLVLVSPSTQPLRRCPRPRPRPSVRGPQGPRTPTGAPGQPCSPSSLPLGPNRLHVLFLPFSLRGGASFLPSASDE